MKKDVLFMNRGVEVLKLVQRFRLLSTKSIHLMLKIQPTQREVRRIVSVLIKKGLLVKANEYVSGSASNYICLSQTTRARASIARILGLNTSEISRQRPSYAQFIHEDMLSRIQFSIEKAFPGSITARDWEIYKSSVPEIVFPRGHTQDSFYPDLVVGIPKDLAHKGFNRSAFSWVAIELERSRKKHSRVNAKLRDYAEQTGFDGLLYLLPESILENRYQQYFHNEATSRAAHLKGLKEAFFATTHLPKEFFNLHSHILNCGKRQLSTHAWLTFLRDSSRQDRDVQWKHQSSIEVKKS